MLITLTMKWIIQGPIYGRLFSMLKNKYIYIYIHMQMGKEDKRTNDMFKVNTIMLHL